MKIEPNNIYLGDSYELIKEIPSGSVDLIYTDIPYDFKKCGYGSGLLKNETRRNTYKNVIGKFDKGIKWEILEEFVRVLKHIYIYIYGVQRHKYLTC